MRGIRIVNQVDLRAMGFPFGLGDIVEHQGVLRRIEGANRSSIGRLQIFWTEGELDRDGDFEPLFVIAPSNDPDGSGFIGEAATPKALARINLTRRLLAEEAAGLFDPKACETIFSESGEFLGFREPIF